MSDLHLDYFLFLLGLAEMALWDEPNVELSAKVCAHNNIMPKRSLNKFIEFNFSVGCMVWP